MENLEQRIKQLELTVLAQKSAIQTLHGALMAQIFAQDGIEHVIKTNELFEITLLAFIKANFNKAKVSPTDYDTFIKSAKKDFEFPNDISAN